MGTKTFYSMSSKLKLRLFNISFWIPGLKGTRIGIHQMEALYFVHCKKVGSSSIRKNKGWIFVIISFWVLDKMSGKKLLIIAKFENCISKNKANVHTCTGTLVPSYFYHKKSSKFVIARNPLRFPSFENENMLLSILWIVAPWIGGSAYIFPLNTQLANTKVHKYKKCFWGICECLLLELLLE